MVVAPPQTKVVNKSEPKVDAVKLAKGRPVFTDDMELPGMLYAALLTSPYAHARIRDIDTEAAERLPGVHAVLNLQEHPAGAVHLRRPELPESAALRPSQPG